MVSLHNHTIERIPENSNILHHEKCNSYLIFHHETSLGDGFRTFIYITALAYCFIGLSAITARFFRSMESVVKHTREVVEIDPSAGAKISRHEKVWNYTIADITLLAFGTSFPQISLATIDAIRNLGNLYAGGLFHISTQLQWGLVTQIILTAFYPPHIADLVFAFLLRNSLESVSDSELLPEQRCLTCTHVSGLGPGTLVGSAAFDLFPIHAVCVVVPRAGELKKISDVGVWLVELFWSFWAYIWLYIILEVICFYISLLLLSV